MTKESNKAKKENRLTTQLLYKQLEIDITGEEYRIGDRLPTEMSICEKYGVSRSSVREASRMLQAEGYIKKKRGSGTYLVSQSPSKGTSWAKVTANELQEFMDVRIAIEVLSIRLFLKHLTPAKVKQIDQAEKEFDVAVKNGNTGTMSLKDEAFHRVISDGSENPLLIDINKLLSDSFREYRQLTFANRNTRRTAVEGHHKIVEAIHNKDTNEAVFCLQSHLMDSISNAIKME